MIAIYVHWTALGYATIGFALACLAAAVLLAILDVRDDRFDRPDRFDRRDDLLAAEWTEDKWDTLADAPPLVDRPCDQEKD